MTATHSCVRTLDYGEHLNHIDEFLCGSPTPHFFPADKIDELKSQLFRHHLIRTDLDPHGTILHRCRNCGYCSSIHEKCTHMTSEMVNLEFQAFEANLRFQIQLVNHTSCHCVNELK
uniref:Platelet-derived growth factor (PDGF) family profile domain-containing protein n=1 Tax=Strigamia maritima TaxID=126957 RepID=T1JB86_STRMM